MSEQKTERRSRPGAPGAKVVVRLPEESSALLAAIVDSTEDAIISKDLNGIITSWNKSAERLYGYTAEEAIGQPMTLIIPSDRPDEEVQILDRLRRGESLQHYETVRVARDGSRRDVAVTISAVRDVSGRIVGASSIGRDISDRLRGEQASASLAAIVDSSDDAIISKDLNGVITSWNKSAERLFGYTAREAVGQPITMLIPPERPNEEAGILASLRRGERIDHLETVRVRKDGTRLHISVTSSPVRDREGRIVGASKIARDITERKEAEAALKEADRRKDEFLAMLAHELRNPLAPISNAVQLLRMAEGNEKAVRAASDMLERQVGQLVQLVDDLVDVNRFNRGRIKLRRQRIQLAPVIAQSVEALRPVCDALHHTLTCSLPPQPIYLNADPTRLVQAISNLLNNACKFTDHGGHVQLTVERESDQAVIRVRDTGVGIAADQLSRIFEMFAQLDTSLERSRGGLGIGLTLVGKIVELHDGTVEAHSAGVAQGSEFVIRLPIASELPVSLPQESSRPEKPAEVRHRVLVVDDNRDAAESLASLLQLSGHEVQTAHDGPEAVAAAATFRPDVILLDIGLPELNGYEAARRIRTQGRDDGVRLIAVTGWGMEVDRRRSRDAGFDAHLVKPVDYAALTKLLAKLDEA